MIKKSIKIIILNCIIFILSSFTLYADENDLSIIVEEHQVENGLKPGDIKNIKFIIKNNTDKKVTIQKINVLEKNRIEEDEILGKIHLLIKDENDYLIKNASLLQYLSNNNIRMLENHIELKPYEELKMSLYVKIDEDLGNEAQGLSKLLNLSAIYTLSDEINVLPKTGGIFNNYTFYFLGCVIIIIGIILGKNRRIDIEKNIK